MQRGGCSYKTSESRLGLDIFLPNGELFDNPTLSANNLLPVSDTLLKSTKFSSNPTTRLKAYALKHGTTPTTEQLKRCDDVERELHRLSFPTDDSFIQDLQHGKIHWASHLTAADVRLNRALRGPCPHQHARDKLFTPKQSLSPPASKPGDQVQFDIQILLAPFPGGFTHEIYFLDEYSSHFASQLIMSKSNEDVMHGIKQYIAKNYTVNQHTLSNLHGDYESINKSLLLPLAELGIKLHLSKPGRHVTRLERYVQTLNGRVTSTRSALPYHFPTKLDPLLRSSVMHTLNNSLHSTSASTPNELMHGANFRTPPIQFGSVHLVTQLLDKQKTIAKHLQLNRKYVPTTEIGVCVGPNLLSKSHNFLTMGGHIGPKASHTQLGSHVIPFNFPKKDYVPIIQLPKFVNNVPISGANTVPSIIPAETISSEGLPPQSSLPDPAVLPTHPPSVVDPVPPRYIPSLGQRVHKLPLRYALSAIFKPHTTSAPFAAATTEPFSTTISRKLDNARRATARNRAHRNTLDLGDLNNKPTDVLPSPLPRNTRPEVSSTAAIKLWGYDKVKAAEDKELTKILTTYKSYKPISKSDITPNNAFIRSLALYKIKSDGTVTCRIPACGNDQPPHTYGPTSALTTDITDSLFLLSVTLKHSKDKNRISELLANSFTGDLPAAFINGLERSMEAEGYTQLITKLPAKLLNTDLANLLCEITGPQYGLVDSNYIYDQDLHNNHKKQQYHYHDMNPRIYYKWSKPGGEFIVIKFYVDDFEGYCDSPSLKQQYKDFIFKRYGPDTVWKNGLGGITGVEYIINPNNSVSVSVGKYLRKLLHKAGMDDVPPAVTPSLGGLFIIDNTSPLLSTSDADEFRTINGAFIWSLPVRSDIGPEVRFLCSRNAFPTQQDRAKQIQLLRYIKSCPDIGPTFSGDCDVSPGIRVNAATDIGHAVHVHSGASQQVVQVMIGDKNAPFFNYCGAEKGVISPDVMSAEYSAFTKGAKTCRQWQQFADLLGFSTKLPSKILCDNNSAINLITSPEITRKSRWLSIKHHFGRTLFQAGLIQPVYTNTNDMGRVDMSTKSPSSININQFLYNRSLLFNDNAKKQ
jgi:hypothetical protein